VAQQIGPSLVGYVECSAKTGHGVDVVFEEAARASLDITKEEKRGYRCIIS